MCTPRNAFRVVMFGLENSGKTTIIKHCSRCAKNSVIRIPPNVQHIDWGPLRVTSIDVGPKQPGKRNAFNGVKALIFVLDSSDYKNFEEAKNRFWCVVKAPRLRRVPVLVLANKSDSPGALLPGQIQEKLGLQCLGGKWKIVRTNAKKGDGIREGLRGSKRRFVLRRKTASNSYPNF